MPKPTYVDAFQHFKKNNNDALKAYVAFGLYVEAECKWAQSQPTWPTQAKYREWFDVSIPHLANAHNDTALDVLQEFAQNIVDQEKTAFIAAAMTQYKQAAAKAAKSFWDGVFEAFVGAACWTIFLIVMAFVIKWVKPDIYEILGRVLGG
jgi:hypothetical protein